MTETMTKTSSMRKTATKWAPAKGSKMHLQMKMDGTHHMLFRHAKTGILVGYWVRPPGVNTLTGVKGFGLSGGETHLGSARDLRTVLKYLERHLTALSTTKRPVL